MRALKHSRRRRRSLYLQKVAISGGHTVHVLHDFQRSARWDVHVGATTLDRAAFHGSSGSVVWTASMALIEWLSAAPDRLRFVVGASILELGSGVGFLGTALRKLGASRVLLTDLEKQLRQIRCNLAANRDIDATRGGSPAPSVVGGGCELESVVRCCSFEWGCDFPAKVRACHWDLIIGCDIVYALDQVEPLADTLAALLVRGGSRRSKADGVGGVSRTRVLLALPDRDDFGYRRRNKTSGEWSPVSDDFKL